MHQGKDRNPIETNGLSPRPLRRALSSPINWAILLSALFLAAVATQLSPHLLGNEEWAWHARTPALAVRRRCWPSLVLLVLYVLFSVCYVDRHEADRPSRTRECLVLGVLVLLAPAIQVALKYMRYPHPLEFYLYRTIGSHNGFWQTAIAIEDLQAYLTTYPHQMSNSNFIHVMTHPPGAVLYVWMWRKALEILPSAAHGVAQCFRMYRCRDLSFVQLQDPQIASALAQMMIPLVSGLPVIPLYLLGKRVSTPRAGFRAAVLYPVLPALTVFTMRWDQIYPLLLCLSLYWVHVGLSDRRPSLLFLAGLSVSAASFMSFGNATILLALGAYSLAHAVWAREASLWQWVQRRWVGVTLLVLGTVSAWVIYQLACRVSFWDVFSTAMQTHLSIGRSYWLWLGWNLYDFLTFLGIPIAVFFIVEAARAWRATVSVPHAVGPPRRLAIAISAVLLTIDLLGVVRGEVGRIWLLWMPVACLMAATYITQCGRRWEFTVGLALVALQTLIFGLFVRMDATGLPRFQPRRPNSTPPEADHHLDARLGHDIALIGYDLQPTEVEPGDTLHLSLHWKAVRQPDLPYTVFVHLLDERGQIRSQHDTMPQQNALPTTCWQPGEFVSDFHPIQLPSDVPPGEYTLRAGMYYLPTGDRLPITVASDSPGDSLTLTTIQVMAVSDP